MPKSSARPPLTRARVIATALLLADEKGVEALSMRMLAGRLGVEAMSLYNHVRNKDDLLDAMVEAVVAGFVRPEAGGDWQAEMLRRARSMRETLVRHPWATPLIIGRVNVGPNMLAQHNAAWGCLVAAGFSYPEADHIINAIDSHLYGFHIQEQSFPFPPEDYAAAARGFMPLIDPVALPHMLAMTELVASGAHDGRHTMDFGLMLMLETLARRLAGRAPPG